MDRSDTHGSVEPQGSRAGRTPIGEEVYDVLLSRILSAEMKPEGRITIDAIARELGVSQTPIREALHRLDAEGVVVRTHLAGYRVAPMMTRELFEDLVELRLLLEPAATRRAAERASDSDLSELRVLADAMRPEVLAESGSRGYALFSQRDAEFHDRIALCGRNTFIRDSLSRLHTHVHLFRLSNKASVTSEAIEEHAEIVAAIGRRDPDAAAYAMRSHIEASARRFGAAFE
ncbi:GntR family transcriptional regulator [Pseudactinotalea suaedae]|uniref:GntR family transcriptional regulator n=1 Tax=Pseudactinotalea suaedae TaxID=1524924 RepID=UPI0012E0F1DA|nr:GntR family transcriptional regulator [Pseudactinotalea suaedae]